MTPQERQMLAELFERIRSVAANPRDAEAEALIAAATREQPYAPYILAQTAIVQRHALDAAAQRIQELEARPAPAAAPTSFLGNLGRSLFGPGQTAPGPGQAAPSPGYDASAYQRAPQPDQPPPRAPAYAPPPAGPWGAPPAAPGGGFLGSAMTTATGVAGGLLAANAIEHLLGGHGGLFGGGFGAGGLGAGGFGAGGFGAGGFGGGETTINNFYDSAPGSADAPADVALPDAGQDQGAFIDSADYDPSGGMDSGGFDDGSGGGFDV